MLVHDIRRESNIFPLPKRRAGHISPHDKTMNTHTSKHQRHLQSCGQEQPSITPITVSGHNKGSQSYVAPKGNEDSCGQLQIYPSNCRTATAHSKNTQLAFRNIPPRLQKQYAAPVGKPNICLDHSTLSKQLCNPVSSTPGPKPDANSFIVDSPLLTHPNPHPPELISDIKAALSAEGIHIGVRSSTPQTQTPQPHIDKTPPTAPAPMSRHDTLRPSGVTPGDHIRALNTPAEPQRPPGLQSPVGRGVALPVASIHVSLPPPSRTNKRTPKENCHQASRPEISVTDLETVTIKSETPKPPNSPNSLNNVKLPAVRGKLRSSSPKPSLGESTAPSNSAMRNTRNLSTSGKDEMCRDWCFSVCDRDMECPYAHKIIPINRPCTRRLGGECARLECPFVHKRQSSDSDQPPVRNGDTRDIVRVPDGPVRDQPLVRTCNTRYGMQGSNCSVKDRPAVPNGNTMQGLAKDQPPVPSGNTRDTMQGSVKLSVPNGNGQNTMQGPAKVQPPVPSGNTRDSVQGPNRPSKDKALVRNGNTRDGVQVLADPVKYQLPVRNSNARAQFLDHPVNDQPPNRNDNTREGVQAPAPEGSVKNQSPIRNGATRGIRKDSNQSLSSSTSNSVQSVMTQISPFQAKSPSSQRPSQADSTNGTPETMRDQTPSNPRVCYDWLQGRCKRHSCRFPHKRSNYNISQTNTPSPIRNTSADDAPASNNSLSQHPLPSLPSPTTRRNEDFVIPVTIADHITVKLRSGFDIQDVTTGFETRWVHLGDVPPNIKESQLRSLLEAYQVDELCIPDGKGAKRLTVKVQFSTAAQAMEASIALHGRQFQGRKLTAKLPLNTIASGTTMLRDTAVRITWSAPQRVGYAGYLTLNEAKAAIAAATGFVMKDNVLTAALYEGLPAVGVYSVMFSHLPPDAERKDLEQFGNAESILLERPNYDSLENARHAVLRALHSCGNLSNFDLVLPIWNGTVLVWANFETHADASNARDHLDGQRPRAIGGKTYISARHVQSLRFSLPLSKFKMLEGDIANLRWTWRTRFSHDVTLVDYLASPDGPVHIKISASKANNLGIAKAEFEQLQRGEVVTLQKKPIWDRFFSQPSGYLFLRELESRYPGIGLRTRMGKILLLGPIEQRQLVRRDIMMRFQELQAQHLWRIPLSGRVVGPFVGTKLVTLQKTLGPENCYVHHFSDQRNLVVRGNEQAYRIACEAVEKVQSRYTDTSMPSQRSVCPVCFTEASVPTILTCGHTWCTSCLESYLVSAVENKAFPLTCLGGDASCNERISVTLAKKILSGEDFASLCDASFWSYVHARTDEFHHCPTPDCAQVYRVVSGGVILQCPSCLVRICSGCHTEAHDGLTCEERDKAEDKLYYEWAATHDVKNCPGCKTPIERSEGCNHMTCARCQTHICWECLATFPKGDGIYDHMRQQHGNIGLQFL